MYKHIPTLRIEEYFNNINLGIDFKLQHFDVPEDKYVNGNISFFETVVICLICKHVHPMNILEFGTFDGRTTCNIAANVPEYAHIITVDLKKNDMHTTKFPVEGITESDEHDERGYIGKKIKRYQKHGSKLKNKIKQLWMDTAAFPVDDYPQLFDFIFVDASHTYANVFNDTKTVMQCINKKGIILWHDYHGWPGVTQALDEYYNNCIDQLNWSHIEGTSLVIYCNNK